MREISPFSRYKALGSKSGDISSIPPFCGSPLKSIITDFANYIYCLERALLVLGFSFTQ